MRNLLINLIISLFLGLPVFSQKISNEEISSRLRLYKNDIRGPYKEIRWFCKDGSILPPQEKCPEPGGVQRARYKDEVNSLAASNHIFLGQILSTTSYDDFWDKENYNSRLKQYQLEKYLRAIDNEWILRKAQYYRGAFQAEDEEEWGINFFNWLLTDNQTTEKYFFLIRQSARDIPHQGDNNLTQKIRAVSKDISDQYTPFLDLRVKIHGQPEISDIEKVILFKEKNSQKIDENISKLFDELISDMKSQYKPAEINSLNKYINKLPAKNDLTKSISTFVSQYKTLKTADEKITILANMLFELRKNITSVPSSNARLAIIDISILLEDFLMKVQSANQFNSTLANLENIHQLGLAATGCGYIEFWEWEIMMQKTSITNTQQLTLEELTSYYDSGRKLVEWSIGMFRAYYSEVINLFSGFEKLSDGFLDDKVRSSMLLILGSSVDKLAGDISEYIPFSNQIMDIQGKGSVRGLNPGIAKGELVVITGQAENINIDKNNIYIFNSPPPDLKPVAGIATVTEGNIVSHVQLLARNLGIPNAVISQQYLEELKKYSGQKVFYAVSSGGTVILKPVDQMTMVEIKLLEIRQRSKEKISVPVEKIDLNQTKIINIKNISAKSSGIICGPKAANLAQLKIMFPDHVVNGIVIPFGIFRIHLDQIIPGQQVSYWDYLNQIFKKAEEMNNDGKNNEKTEAFILNELSLFRKYISQINLLDSFTEDLKNSFLMAFGKEIGSLPVFLRSDTNMEDLKDFTGAGLNLTLFNVVVYEAILNGIKEVWSSPYTERSYKWRQQYLLNPENVFPSILIIPSVNVDISGVMVTKGIANQNEDDLTIAFSRGAGGAVDGQAAESYILDSNGHNTLIAPAREPTFNRLSENGGVKKYFATFETPVLNKSNINSLRHIAQQIKKQLPNSPGIETTGPFDIELGFKDGNLWLFQVRPFVENKNAATSEYLNSLNVKFDKNKIININ